MKASTFTAAALVALGLVAAGCSSDKTTTTTAAATTAEATTAAPATTAAASTEAPTTAATNDAIKLLDANGDGKVQFGIAAAGPKDDGAYYQALVDEATKVSKDNGFETAIGAAGWASPIPRSTKCRPAPFSKGPSPSPAKAASPRCPKS